MYDLDRLEEDDMACLWLHTVEDFAVPLVLPLSCFFAMAKLHENHVTIDPRGFDHSEVTHLIPCAFAHEGQEVCWA